MSRPRTSDPDLPPRVYPKHGRFWYVYRGAWTALSQDREEAIEAGKRLNEERGPGWSHQLQKALESSFAARQRNAKACGVEFAVALSGIIDLARASRWRCAVTALPFSLERMPGKRRAPFAPSIDRIDSDHGYIPGNVRVVCLATNLAMNEWGDSVMQRLAEGWLRGEFKRRVLDV